MKRAPTITLGNYHIRYIQVPYGDRYYVIHKKGKNPYYDLKIPQVDKCRVTIVLTAIVQEAGIGCNSVEFSRILTRFQNFIERVQKRNEYLDRDE